MAKICFDKNCYWRKKVSAGEKISENKIFLKLISEPIFIWVAKVQRDCPHALHMSVQLVKWIWFLFVPLLFCNPFPTLSISPYGAVTEDNQAKK